MGLSTETFAWVADLVRRRSAIQLATGKEYLVESRLLPHARAAGAADVDDYVRRVRAANRPGDLELVVEALTTNETSWMRDAAPFTALRTHVLPTLLKERGSIDRLSVWSAACSTGQEPYSIAMVLSDALPLGVRLQIHATDLSEQVLARAREGRYSQLEVNRGLPAPQLVRHFRRAGTEWQIDDALRRQVTFARHNLLDAPPAVGPFDIVFLRNVLIYFDLPTKRAILERVLRVLRPDGVLLLGAAESTLGVHEGFERVTVERSSVYRPLAARGLPAPAVPSPRPAGLAHASVPPTVPPSPSSLPVPAAHALSRGAAR